MAPDRVGYRISAHAVACIALAQAAAATLHADPFFYDAHVTLTVHDGILTLHGIVVNYMEIKLGGE